MNMFPLYVDLQDKDVLVIGGGPVAERKIQLLLHSCRRIRVVAPSVCESLRVLARDERIELISDRFDPKWMDDAWFVIAATNRSDINRQVADAARSRRLFVNVVDDPSLSSVHVPAIVNRSPLLVAISSSGAAPMIARHVREQIETLIDDAMGQLAALACAHRDDIRHARPTLPDRRKFYEWMIRGPVLQHLRNGDTASARLYLEKALQDPQRPEPGHTFHIHVISDDPGDITLKALRALNRADTIFYDDQVPAGILELARRDAERRCFVTPSPASATGLPGAIAQAMAQNIAAGRVNVLLTREPGRDTEQSAMVHDPHAALFIPTIPDTYQSRIPITS